MAGLLTRSSPDAFPSCTRQTVAGVLPGLQNEAYSSGVCSGFPPDSLLFPLPNDKRKTNTRQRYTNNPIPQTIYIKFRVLPKVGSPTAPRLFERLPQETGGIPAQIPVYPKVHVSFPSGFIYILNLSNKYSTLIKPYSNRV